MRYTYYAVLILDTGANCALLFCTHWQWQHFLNNLFLFYYFFLTANR